jgi:hypothetical protein
MSFGPFFVDPRRGADRVESTIYKHALPFFIWSWEPVSALTWRLSEFQDTPNPEINQVHF